MVRHIPHCYPMPWEPKAWPRWAKRVLVPSRPLSKLLLRASRRLLVGSASLLLRMNHALTIVSMEEWERRGWWKRPESMNQG